MVAFFVLIFAISAVGFVLTLYELQWVVIDSTHISAHNIFGLVKKLEISKIQAVIKINAMVFGLKMYTKRFPCIAVSYRKSLRASEIDNAYNKKKYYYIIFPLSEDNRQILEIFKCSNETNR